MRREIRETTAGELKLRIYEGAIEPTTRRPFYSLYLKHTGYRALLLRYLCHRLNLYDALQTESPPTTRPALSSFETGPIRNQCYQKRAERTSVASIIQRR